MREWRIPVTWEMYGIVYVEADTLEEAMDKAYDSEIPDDGEYLDGSWEVESDVDLVRECYNGNAPDEAPDSHPEDETGEETGDIEIDPADISELLQINVQANQ